MKLILLNEKHLLNYILKQKIDKLKNQTEMLNYLKF